MNSDPICNAMEYGSVSSNHVSITFNNRPAILGTPSLVKQREGSQHKYSSVPKFSLSV